jgi:hypothetical protein
MTPQFLQNERIAQLLVDRAIDGLDTESERDLKRLSRQYPDYEDDAIDRVAAAVSISHLTSEEVPEGLRERLESDARRWIKGHTTEGADVVDLGSRRDRPAPRPWMQWLAAASILVAAVGWYQASMVAMERDSLQAQLATLGADLESQRQLVAQLRNPPAPDLGTMRARLAGAGAPVVAWSITEDPAASEASGDLVWDDRRQEGYMRFKNLAPNDPDVYQYQLWIFDATRDERHPVDGGVFDVPAGSDEVIVPIRAKLPVGAPVLFAITVERPGGVVVSDRERIALVAKPNQEI